MNLITVDFVCIVLVYVAFVHALRTSDEVPVYAQRLLVAV
jgi:hypothetical protein